MLDNQIDTLSYIPLLEIQRLLVSKYTVVGISEEKSSFLFVKSNTNPTTIQMY